MRIIIGYFGSFHSRLVITASNLLSPLFNLNLKKCIIDFNASETNLYNYVINDNKIKIHLVVITVLCNHIIFISIFYVERAG